MICIYIKHEYKGVGSYSYSCCIESPYQCEILGPCLNSANYVK